MEKVVKVVNKDRFEKEGRISGTKKGCGVFSASRKFWLWWATKESNLEPAD